MTFPKGETMQSFTVMITGDRDPNEGYELFFVKLTNPSGVVLGSTQALGYIVDDEPSVWIDYYASGAEGNSGTRT